MNCSVNRSLADLTFLVRPLLLDFSRTASAMSPLDLAFSWDANP
jgi:hypothetical protein